MIGYSLLISQQIFQAYMEDGNYITIEDYIGRVIIFNGDISGNTAVLVDAANIFENRALKKINPKIRTEAAETHEAFWQTDSVQVTKSSNASVPQIIPLNKLQRSAKKYLFVNVVYRIESAKPAIWLKEGAYNEEAVAHIYYISNKKRVI